MKKLGVNQQGAGMLMVLGFMGLAIPIITTALALTGGLSSDSQVKTHILKDQYNGLGVRDYVLYLMNDPQIWQDWFAATGGADTITINGEVINFTVTPIPDPPGYSPMSKIKVYKGAVVQGDLVSAGSAIEVESNATVQGNIRAGKEVKLGENSLVQGDVLTSREVVIKNGGRVEGNVTAGDAVTLESGAVVTGIIAQNQSSLPPIVPTGLLTLPILSPGSNNITVGPGQIGRASCRERVC